MPTVHTHYMTWASRRRRHQGATAGDIVAPLSTASSGGTYQAWAPPQITWGGGASSANFAFWSVTGASDGASVTTSQSLTVSVGSGDVTATAWYLPAGGDGPGGPGLDIDAFDVGLGDFVDDDFVTVAPDGGLTADANWDGWVPTGSAEDVDAYAAIHAVPFSTWTVVYGSETTTNEDLHGDQGSSAIAFAFYQVPASSPTPVFPHGRQYEEGTWVSWGVKVDGGGPTGNGPVPPWTPYVRELVAGLALAETAALVNANLRGSVLRLAARQVSASAGAISKQMQAGASAKQLQADLAARVTELQAG